MYVKVKSVSFLVRKMCLSEGIDRGGRSRCWV